MPFAKSLVWSSCGCFFRRLRLLRLFGCRALGGQDSYVELRCSSVSKRYFNFLLAALLDRLVERNRMPWQPDIAEFLNETVVEILCRDRPEGLSGLSGLEREIQDELIDPGGELFGRVKFARPRSARLARK